MRKEPDMGWTSEGARKRAVAMVVRLIVAGVLGGLAGGPARAAYAPDPLYGDADITNPTADDIWLAGSPHDITCDFADGDCNLETGEVEDDGVICTWEGGSGDFPDGNVGLSVKYVCVDTAGTDWVAVEAKDAGNLEPDGQPDVHDCETFEVVIPSCEELDFCGLYNYPMADDQDNPQPIGIEYDSSEQINEPACQQMGGTVTLAGVKFVATMNLSEGSSVEVKADGTIGFPPTADAWQEWDSGGISLTSVNEVANCVRKYDNNFVLPWSYRCPEGSGNWIGCGETTHTVYVVRSEPIRNMVVPWQKILDYSCVWAEGQVGAQEAFAAIWDKIDDLNATDMKYWGAAPPAGGATTKGLLKHKDGKCGAWGEFFDHLCACQGITAEKKGIVLKNESPYPPHVYSMMIVYDIDFGPMRFDPPFRYRFTEIDFTPAGIPGQGMPTPSAKHFSNHAVNVYGGKIYDPSYGKGPYDDLHAWEEDAIEAYGSIACPPPPSGEADCYIKVNGFRETEVKWE
jgi:hypothetical protein